MAITRLQTSLERILQDYKIIVEDLINFSNGIF